MAQPLADLSLDQIFREARTRNGWVEEPIAEEMIRQIYDLAKFGPTSANMSPARFVWCVSAEARAKIAALSSSTNADKIRQAPATVIVGYDLDFPEMLPRLFPHAPDAKNWFGDPKLREDAAFRNSSLQGAYLIIAARALGYDCGPMSGFDNAKVDEAFFAGTRVKSNFICSVGHGTDHNLFPRNPRLEFEEANTVL